MKSCTTRFAFGGKMQHAPQRATGLRGEEILAPEQRGERDAAQTAAGAEEKFAARERVRGKRRCQGEMLSFISCNVGLETAQVVRYHV